MARKGHSKAGKVTVPQDSKAICYLLLIGITFSCSGWISIPLNAASSDIQKQLKRDLKLIKKSPTAPESGEVWLRVAEVYQQLKQRNETLNALERAIAILPPLSLSRATALEQLGDCLASEDFERSNAVQAAKHYREAIAIAPTHAAVRLQKLSKVMGLLDGQAPRRRIVLILKRFFPDAEPTIETIEAQESAPSASPDELESALDAIEQQVAAKSVSANSLWKGIQALLKSKSPQWPVILELTEQVLEKAPDFEHVEWALLARARAFTAMKRELEAWIAYGALLQRLAFRHGTKDTSSLPQTLSIVFLARAELAESLAQNDWPRLAAAHVDILQSHFPKQIDDLTKLYGFIGEQAMKGRQYSLAIQIYEKLAAIDHPNEIWLSAPKYLAAAYKANGQFEKAMETYRTFLAGYPARMDRYLENGNYKNGPEEHKGYFKNRERLAVQSSLSNIEKRLFHISTETGDARQAKTIRLGQLVDLSGYPTGREQWIEEARNSLKSTNIDKAIFAYLNSIKPAKTALPQMAPKNVVNQQYLKELRRPQREEVLKEIFEAILNQLPLRLGENATETPADDILHFWMKYWPIERDGRYHDAREMLKTFIMDMKLSSTASSHPLTIYLSYVLGMNYQREGLHFRAIPVFQDALALLKDAKSIRRPHPALYDYMRLVLSYSSGLSYFRAGQYEDAIPLFKNASFRGELIPQASYRIAQCYEYQAYFTRAKTLYDELSRAETTPHGLRQLSALSTNRIGQLKNRRKEDGSIVYIGENRSDWGHWKYNHPGRGGLILCGMTAPNDFVRPSSSNRPRTSSGLKIRPLNYRVSTADPEERGRRWVSLVDDPSPTALWNPVRHTHTSSNWDDFGEQKPLGKGPGIIIDLDIPQGDWRLSLSFINDHNYYEPNRAWTVYLKDAKHDVQAACDIEDHLSGVYKHFAVRGPKTIQVHVFRMLSLNTLLSGIFLDPLHDVSGGHSEENVAKQTTKTETAGKKLSLIQHYYTSNLDRPKLNEVSNTSWKLIRAAESLLQSNPSVTIEDKRKVLWMLWQSKRWAAASADDERKTIADWVSSLVQTTQTSGAIETLTTLRDWHLEHLELGRAELLEDQRHLILLPTLSLPQKNEELLHSTFLFYPLDQTYAAQKFKPVLNATYAEAEEGKRGSKMESLAKQCRKQKAWRLADMTYSLIEAGVPIVHRTDEHFRHYFRVAEYQQHREIAIQRIEKHLAELPNSRWDLLWRYNLVHYHLATGAFDKAIKANSQLEAYHPKHISTPNMDFVFGLAYIDRNNMTEAKKRFSRVVKDYPETFWAQRSKSMLKQFPNK